LIEEAELIVLLLGLGVGIFIIINYSKIKEIPKLGILLTSLTFFSIGWGFTVLEGFLYPDVLNLMEHLCYTLGSLAIVIWILKADKEEEHK
jgi:hypothetical protein